MQARPRGGRESIAIGAYPNEWGHSAIDSRPLAVNQRPCLGSLWLGLRRELDVAAFCFGFEELELPPNLAGVGVERDGHALVLHGVGDVAGAEIGPAERI